MPQLFSALRVLGRHTVMKSALERGATEDQAVANANLPQYRRFQGYSRAMEIAVRRTYRELTGVLD